MSTTNILAELQRETQWLRTNRSLHQHGLRKQQSQLTEALANEKAAIEALDWLHEYFGVDTTPVYDDDEGEYFTLTRHVRKVLAAYKARQSAGQPSAVPAGDSNENGA